MAASRSVLLMLMIASLASGVLAVLLSIAVGSSQMLITSVPGFVVGAFFGLKYALYGKNKEKEEEHKRSRNRHRH